jgi:hypothetical protein
MFVWISLYLSPTVAALFAAQARDRNEEANYWLGIW